MRDVTLEGTLEEAILRLAVLQGPILLPHDPVAESLLMLHPWDPSPEQGDPVRFSPAMLQALLQLQRQELIALRGHEFSGPAFEHLCWWEPHYAGLLVPTPKAWELACRWTGVVRSAAHRLTFAERAALGSAARRGFVYLGEAEPHTWHRLANRRLIEFMGRPGHRIAAVLPFGVLAMQQKDV